MPHLPSPDEIKAADRTGRGGWTRAQLAEWGVPRPPPRGWKADLERRYAASKAAYLSDRFVWAAPGDQQEDVWLVRFDDNDLRDATFTGADAGDRAWDAWNAHAPSYNMRVFRLARLSEGRR